MKTYRPNYQLRDFLIRTYWIRHFNLNTLIAQRACVCSCADTVAYTVIPY